MRGICGRSICKLRLVRGGYLFARSRHEPTIVFTKPLVGVRLYDGGMYGGDFVMAASGQAIGLGPPERGARSYDARRRPPRRPPRLPFEAAALAASGKLAPSLTASITRLKAIHSPPLASLFIRKFAALMASISI
jgi:hypothetical protein